MRSLVLALLVVGCQPPPIELFPLLITANSDEGEPLPGLAVQIDGRAVGRTDGSGALEARLPGPKGRPVAVAVAAPDGYRAIVDARTLSLDRLEAVRGGGAARPLCFSARFAPRARRMVVLVDVGVADLPVELFGVPHARTNAAGTAMILATGTPGDHVEVRVTRGARTDLTPPFVADTFTIPDEANALVLAGSFHVITKKAPRPVRPRRL